MLGLLVYFVLANSEAPLGPVIAGRALPWLVLQVLAVTVVATAITTTIAWRRTRTTVTAASRFRLGLRLAGALAFIPWAAYWGLLLP